MRAAVAKATCASTVGSVATLLAVVRDSGWSTADASFSAEKRVLVLIIRSMSLGGALMIYTGCSGQRTDEARKIDKADPSRTSALD